MAEDESNEQRIIRTMVSAFFSELITQVKTLKIGTFQKLIIVQIMSKASGEFSKMTLAQLQELVPTIDRMKAQIDLGELPSEFNEVRMFVSGDNLTQVIQMLQVILTQFQKCIEQIQAQIEIEKTMI